MPRETVTVSPENDAGNGRISNATQIRSASQFTRLLARIALFATPCIWAPPAVTGTCPFFLLELNSETAISLCQQF